MYAYVVLFGLHDIRIGWDTPRDPPEVCPGSGALWKFFGDIIDVLGHSGSLIEASKTFCDALKAFWRFLRRYGTAGSLWDALGRSGSLLEASGTLWDILQPLWSKGLDYIRTLWDAMGAFWRPPGRSGTLRDLYGGLNLTLVVFFTFCAKDNNLYGQRA